MLRAGTVVWEHHRIIAWLIGADCKIINVFLGTGGLNIHAADTSDPPVIRDPWSSDGYIIYYIDSVIAFPLVHIPVTIVSAKY